MKLLHLSDLHLRKGWDEELGVVHRHFSDALKRIVDPSDPPYLIFSGDFVQSGADAQLFDLFANKFATLFDSLGITRERRCAVPGNHDISRRHVSEKLPLLWPLIKYNDNEKSFNDAIYTQYKDLTFPKFYNYFSFESQHFKYGCTEDRFCGNGFTLPDGIGLYLLNTAIDSFG